MRFLKPLIFFLIAVVIAGFALSFLLPTHQQIERSVTIKAPASVIYTALSKLETFNSFSVWSRQDSSAVYTMKGTDGSIGAVSSWKGDPGISGEGSIEITALEPDRKVSHTIRFTHPKNGKANSIFTINENAGLSTVTWLFTMDTPRPWNIYNLFYSMDKELGKDFDFSLQTLKAAIEKTDTVSAKNYEVMTMDFPASSFAVVRQKVKWADITSFYAQHVRVLYGELQQNKVLPGNASGLFYTWDEKNQQTDMAAAVPVPKGTVIKNPIVQVIGIPASKAVYVNYYGNYDNEATAYASIHKFIADKGWKEKYPFIEQYITGPASEKDTSKWVTKIIFMVE